MFASRRRPYRPSLRSLPVVGIRDRNRGAGYRDPNFPRAASRMPAAVLGGFERRLGYLLALCIIRFNLRDNHYHDGGDPRYRQADARCSKHHGLSDNLQVHKVNVPERQQYFLHRVRCAVDGLAWVQRDGKNVSDLILSHLQTVGGLYEIIIIYKCNFGFIGRDLSCA